MAANSAFLFQTIILLAGLVSLVWALRTRHLLRKILGWTGFHLAVLSLWVSTFSAYHDQLNPFPVVILIVLTTAFLGVASVMLLLVLGVLKRQGSFEPEDKA